MKAEVRLRRIAERQYGIIALDQALSCGMPMHMIRYRLTSGRWHTVHRGVYRIDGAPVTPESEVLGAVLASGPGALASFATAGWLWRLPGFERRDTVEVSVPGRRRVRVPGLRVHRPMQLLATDGTKLRGIPTTGASRTLADLSTVLCPTALERCLDEFLRRGLLDARILTKRLSSIPSSGRRAIRALKDLVEARVDGPSTGSPLENNFLSEVRRLGLPEPVRQFDVCSGDGTFLGRVDFAYPTLMIGIEVDGYAFHAGRQRWEADHSRQNRLIEAGWVILRFTDRSMAKTGALTQLERTIELQKARLGR